MNYVQSRPTQLQDLPNEILLEIFQYLSFTYLFDAFYNLESHRFRALLVSARPSVTISDNINLTAIQVFSPHTHFLNVRYCHRLYDMRMFDNVRWLQVMYHFTGLQELMSTLPYLERLFTCDEQTLSCIFNENKQSSTLNSVHFRGYFFKPRLSGFTRPNLNIRSFTFHGVCFIKELAFLLRFVPELQFLRLNQWLDFNAKINPDDLLPAVSVVNLDIALVYVETIFERRHLPLVSLLPNIERIRIRTALNKPVEFLFLYEALQQWRKLKWFHCRITLEWSKHSPFDSLLKLVRSIPLFHRIQCHRHSNNQNLLLFYTTC